MLSLNRAMIIGNLTRDPELRYTQTGRAVASFAIATNRTWVDPTSNEKQEATEYHDIVAWGKLAEVCNQILKKGYKVFVEGRLQTRNWEAQDGAKRTKTEIVAENMMLISRPGGGVINEPSVMPATAPATSEDSAKSPDEINLEDIPF
jgi:single-strand DNA-binding protein